MKIVNFTNKTRTLYKATKQKISDTYHFAEIDAQKPQVKLGWYRKVKCTPEERKATGKKYKLVEATMSKEQYEKIQKDPLGPIRKFFYGMAMFITVISAKSNIDFVKYISSAERSIVENIEKARSLALVQDTVVSDGTIKLPIKLAKIAGEKNSIANKFYTALKDNKENLMQDLEIDSKTYDRLVKIAMQIAKEESKYGKSKKYKIYSIIEKHQDTRDIFSGIRKYKEAVTGLKKPDDKDGILSLGLTRFKIDDTKPEEKALFKKYGINQGQNTSNIQEDPGKSAIATIIHLANIDKDYPIYVQKVDSLKPDELDFNVMKSIANAKRIIFDDQRRPIAIQAIMEEGMYEEARPQQAGIHTILYPYEHAIDVTTKDLEDIKIFAKTVKLSPEAYLAARWNGRKIIPSGTENQIKLAYKNLINIIAQKGYVSNIDKTSKIDY